MSASGRSAVCAVAIAHHFTSPFSAVASLAPRPVPSLQRQRLLRLLSHSPGPLQWQTDHPSMADRRVECNQSTPPCVDCRRASPSCEPLLIVSDVAWRVEESSSESASALHCQLTADSSAPSCHLELRPKIQTTSNEVKSATRTSDGVSAERLAAGRMRTAV